MTTRTINALRISSDDGKLNSQHEDCDVVQETPITFDVEGVGTYTVMALPDNLRALAVGFLAAEGLIKSIDDIALLNQCLDDPHVFNIKLSNTHSCDSAKVKRNMTVISACGLCGSQSMNELIESLPKVNNILLVKPEVLHCAIDEMHKGQTLFKTTGGTHAAAIFTKDGEVLATAEDIGRHNALDKVIGHCILNRTELAGHAAALSGRVSLEMIVKCARAGLELIAAISAPTSLAIETSEKVGITLCSFVRKNRLTVFSHPQRLKYERG